jgi:methionyl-tRNA formyltransferase
MLIQILCDNPRSWIIPHANELAEILRKRGHDTRLLSKENEVIEGDILVLLSCEKIFKQLHLNEHNLVVHESALPNGKGWSPLTWQVLEGKNKIPVTLIEATEKVDAGLIYNQIIINLDGTELIDELRAKQAEATIDLITKFVDKFPKNEGIPQQGKETFYARRKPEHSKLDINKSIAEQFNLLRVCDNDRYPAWFEMNGTKYIMRIFKETS